MLVKSLNMIKKVTIGVQYLDTYPEKRNIVNIISNVNYVSVEDWYRKLANLKIKLRSYTRLKRSLGGLIAKKDLDRYSFYLPNKDNEINFFHFFNTINLKAKQPWGVTFEATLPHFPPFSDYHKDDFPGGNKKALRKIKKYLKALADDKCKFIIALSNCNYKIQESLLSNFPEYKFVIEKKIQQIHPPQKVLLNSFSEKESINGKVNFVFVGRDLLGKGGGEVIKVFSRLINQYSNFHLYLIGDFQLNSVTAKDFTKNDVIEFKRFIEENKKDVTYFPFLENKDLLELLRDKIHVGMLPTRADTYGYSVLEFQAAGCAVVSTGLRALTEINNEDIGWLINVKTNEFGESFHYNKEQLKKLSVDIEKGLEECIISILKNPNQIIEKQRLSLERIKMMHNVDNYRDKLKDIYNDFIE